MNLLVTGSSGYIGRSFISIFKNKYTYEKFSLLNSKLINIDFSHIEVVVHCAALVHQKTTHPYSYYSEVNIEYPVKLALCAKQSGVKQFVFISTVAVYGNNATYLDEHSQLNPVTLYGKSKMEAEEKLLGLNDDGFIVSIIRPPMVYGINAPGNIKTLIRLIRYFTILPFGSINNRRSFVYIGNLCYLIDEIITQRMHGIFLASDDNPISTTKLIELIAKNLDKKVFLIKIPFFEYMLKRFKPSFYNRLYDSLEINNDITMQKLGITNPHSTDEGIKLMIKGEQ